MLKKLNEFGERGGIIRKILAFVASLVLIFGSFAIGFLVSLYLCAIIDETIGSAALTMLSIFTLLPIGGLGPIFLLAYGLPGKHKSKEEEKEEEKEDYSVFSTSLPLKPNKFGELPHFGKMFGSLWLKELLRDEVFHRYTYQSGKEARFLKVSESGKWISFWGGYLPIDLIIGYNKRKAELYTVDGNTILLPFIAHSTIFSRELENFFKEKGEYYTAVPEHAWLEFAGTNGAIDEALAKKDWGAFRYLWEKNLLNKHKKKAGSSTDIYERVLSDKEINRIVRDVKAGNEDLLTYLNFDRYKNDQSVCNGVELLRLLGYPKNVEGVDFLFDCLGDVDEPYFFMAVEVLKIYPKKVREERIEYYAKLAHENGDVEKFGGLLYLAKELKYEIKYVDKMKKMEDKKEEENGLYQASRC
ncbi:hypothetical protein [Butyrivibrio sp. NC2007]|uniref:hypothetical protein n=1 Tax=Butyrivibrio sp. NC2007 TaxID=1280683 RepID=UPI0003B671B1|nr:hypothetical protein [Butyrivibrio sp. NC2007]